MPTLRYRYTQSDICNLIAKDLAAQGLRPSSPVRISIERDSDPQDPRSSGPHVYAEVMCETPPQKPGAGPAGPFRDY